MSGHRRLPSRPGAGRRPFNMSQYERLSSLEAQPTNSRRREDPSSGYTDDPEFKALADDVAKQLESLASNVGKLQNSINRLGSRHDTESLREQVKRLLEQTRDGYKNLGDNVKRLQAWEDITVRHHAYNDKDID
jgi:ElaB/YqjD/DUF883 family membrane-anchored ribosome-binding protein